VVVFGLAWVAGSSYELWWPRPFALPFLALGMLLTHFAIGAANDWADVEADRQTKPRKPIPAGLITRREAALVAVVTSVGGIVLATLAPGAAQPVTSLLLVATLGAGLAYVLYLKPTALSWLPFAVAFTILPVYTWLGAVGELPPRLELLLPVAFLAGPMLQLANGLVDIERDAAVGSRGLAERLGRRWAWRVMAGLQIFVNVLAWLTIGPMAEAGGLRTISQLVGASVLSALGVLLSAGRADLREWGWRLQAVGLVLLTLAWLAAVPRSGPL
jgi:4-hydroxybenzoate polyprenyltransferase